MTRMSRALFGMCALYLCAINSSWAQDDYRQTLSMQLITSSYMLRFHSYFGSETVELAGSMDPQREQQAIQKALAELSVGDNGASITASWVLYERALENFGVRWQEQQYPDWYSLQDVDSAHKQLLAVLQESYGDSTHFTDNLELLDLMEFYMHNSTEVVQSNRTPRGNEYDLSVVANAFDRRVQQHADEEILSRAEVVRWKYIKPLFVNQDLQASPTTMIRHGGALSRALAQR